MNLRHATALTLVFRAHVSAAPLKGQIELHAKLGRRGFPRSRGKDRAFTLVFWTTDNGAWSDVHPTLAVTPFRAKEQ